eukprot:scaffold22.g6128.t1
MALGPETAKAAMVAIEKLKRYEPLAPAEEYAVERLWSFLSHAQEDGLSLELQAESSGLDEAQRAYVLSFKRDDLVRSGRRLTLAGQQSGAAAAAAAAAQRGGAARRPSTAPAARGAGAPARAGGGQAAPPAPGASAQQEQGSQQEQQQPPPQAQQAAQGQAAQAEGAAPQQAEQQGRGAADPALGEQLGPLLLDWERFDVFRVAALTRGRPLAAVALALLRRLGLGARLGLPEGRLGAFFEAAEALYGPNPYHNSAHAADVTQGLAAMLAAEPGLQAQLSDLELLALVFAAAVHDLGHPGVNNEFLVRTGSEAALRYNDRAVNENCHLAAAFGLLAHPANNFLSHLCEDDFCVFRATVINIVLATDMARHHDMVREFAEEVRLWGPDLGAWPPAKRTLALQVLGELAPTFVARVRPYIAESLRLWRERQAGGGRAAPPAAAPAAAQRCAAQEVAAPISERAPTPAVPHSAEQAPLAGEADDVRR